MTQEMNSCQQGDVQKKNVTLFGAFLVLTRVLMLLYARNYQIRMNIYTGLDHGTIIFSHLTMWVAYIICGCRASMLEPGDEKEKEGARDISIFRLAVVNATTTMIFFFLAGDACMGVLMPIAMALFDALIWLFFFHMSFQDWADDGY